MWDFTKFKGNKQDFELSEKAIVEANPLGQNEHNSEEQLDELLSVNEGQVTIHFTSAMAVDGALLVGFFVSNGLSHKLKFDDIPLVLMDSDRRVSFKIYLKRARCALKSQLNLPKVFKSVIRSSLKIQMKTNSLNWDVY